MCFCLDGDTETLGVVQKFKIIGQTKCLRHACGYKSQWRFIIDKPGFTNRLKVEAMKIRRHFKPLASAWDQHCAADDLMETVPVGQICTFDETLSAAPDSMRLSVGQT